VAAGFLFGRGERGDVGGIFDLGALVIVAWMRGDDRCAIEHADLLGAGQHGEHAAHMGMRDRVIVEVICSALHMTSYVAYKNMLTGWPPARETTALPASVAQHIHARFRREAISLSGARNWPRLSVGGIDFSIASIFSVGSARK